MSKPKAYVTITRSLPVAEAMNEAYVNLRSLDDEIHARVMALRAAHADATHIYEVMFEASAHLTQAREWFDRMGPALDIQSFMNHRIDIPTLTHPYHLARWARRDNIVSELSAIIISPAVDDAIIEILRFVIDMLADIEFPQIGRRS